MPGGTTGGGDDTFEIVNANPSSNSWSVWLNGSSKCYITMPYSEATCIQVGIESDSTNLNPFASGIIDKSLKWIDSHGQAYDWTYGGFNVNSGYLHNGVNWKATSLDNSKNITFSHN